MVTAVVRNGGRERMGRGEKWGVKSGDDRQGSAVVVTVGSWLCAGLIRLVVVC